MTYINVLLNTANELLVSICWAVLNKMYFEDQ